MKPSANHKFEISGLPTQEAKEFIERLQHKENDPTCSDKPVKSRAKKKGEVVSKPIVSAVKPLESPDPFIVTTKILADDDSWIPQYKTEGAACVDLKANIPPDVHGKREINLPYRVGQVIDCGFSLSLPPGFKAEIAARSGWASRGLVVSNAPGQIDEDYVGRIRVAVYNVGKEILKIEHGDRIAQMWPTPVYRFKWEKVTELEQTVRGTGGYGSTGVQ